MFSPSSISSRLLLLAWVVFALTLSACGQIITKPTPPSATATPTLTATFTATPAATPTPAPYTPAPSPTPTITPTPVIHTIAKGDTLIVIANRYGVTVEAIQEANGITDPRLLRIGQTLIIPSDVSAKLGGGTPTPVPTPMPVSLGSINFGHDPTGDLWAMGMVTNPGDTPLEGVSVRLVLVDEAGTDLATASAFILDDILLPGERSAFGIRFRSPPPAFSNYMAEVLTAYPAHQESYYLDLVTEDVKSEGEGYHTQLLSGYVRNLGPEDATHITVSAVLLDALDNVLGFRRTTPPQSLLPPGGRIPFQLEIIPLGGPVDHVEFHVLGRRLPTPTPTA
ncbi:MAG: LysM peptidoglycan-binding domain-containing protein [Chloroflexi bacterium]|nr:LysM peptidoglycan-binding domain-containing protein [Chloroflexota bacterium]